MYPEILPPLLSDVPEEERRRVEPKKPLKQVYKDFTTVPIPLPVWLWIWRVRWPRGLNRTGELMEQAQDKEKEGDVARERM